MLRECLEGCRVLDLSQYLPGPFATQMLADLGASVIKVEPPAGDPMRRFRPLDRDGISPFYKQLNAAKTVVLLDLKTPVDQIVFKEMVTRADVMIESYRPGVLDRLGFDRKYLEELNPRLVHCSLSGFGQSGPYRLRAGHDLTYLALTGGMNVTGTPSTPVMTFPPVADHAGAMQAVTAVLGGLLRRERLGRGVRLDVSLFETALSWQATGLTAASRKGWEIERGGNLLTGGAACYQIYRTADGRFAALAAIEEKFWSAFCTAVGRPDWIPRQFETFPQYTLIEEVAALVSSRTLARWQADLGEVDCCFEPVLTYAEVADHPQVQARGLLHRHGGTESLTEVSFAALFDGHPPHQRPPLRVTSGKEALSSWSL